MNSGNDVNVHARSLDYESHCLPKFYLHVRAGKSRFGLNENSRRQVRQVPELVDQTRYIALSSSGMTEAGQCDE